MSDQIQQLQNRIEAIEKRNEQVSVDKTWETSSTRRLLLIVFTYVTIGLYLQAISVVNAWIHAIVPALSFFLSTLTLPFFKNLWIRMFGKKV